MDTFKVVTSIPATVTHTYYIIAKDEKDAIEKMTNGEYEDVEMETELNGDWDETVIEEDVAAMAVTEVGASGIPYVPIVFPLTLVPCIIILNYQVLELHSMRLQMFGCGSKPSAAT